MELFYGGQAFNLSYNAWGQRRSPNSWEGVYNFGNPIFGITDIGFTGQEHVDSMGLIDYNARMYDPELGMMIQADTVIPDGPAIESTNRYAYVFNNPLSYIDPTGHNPFGWYHNALAQINEKTHYNAIK